MFEHEGHTTAQVARARRFRAGMTIPEQRLWRELRSLPAHIRRQAPIGPYVADFVCHAKRLVIEVDGGVHEQIAEVAARDQARTEWLESQGYRVVRFVNGRVINDLPAVVHEIERHLALPLDGEGLGWGAAAEPQGRLGVALAPTCASRPGALRSTPSPALPSSRGKGE